MGTRIVTCSCHHDYQDRRYGKNRRLANITDGGGARCTVCGTATGKPATPKPAPAAPAKK